MTWIGVFEENGAIEEVKLKADNLVAATHQAQEVLMGNWDEHPALRLVVVQAEAGWYTAIARKNRQDNLLECVL